MKKSSIRRLSFDEILDLNYVLKPEFLLLQKFPKRAKIKNIFSGVKLFWALLIKSLLSKKTKYPKVKNIDFLFISGSQNNSKVLKPLYRTTPNALYLDEKSIPKFWAYWYSIPFFFKALRYLRLSAGYERKIQIAYFERFWSVYGYYKMTKKLLISVNPKVVVVANDHLLLYRCILKVSKELNIKTLYIQHAGTAPHFPPLEFDYAILDGKISYEKYQTQKEKNTATVFLAGSPRFDEIVNINNTRKSLDIKTLGVAVNTIDDPKLVFNFLTSLKLKTKYPIILRLHPGIKGKKLFTYKKFIQENQIFISDPSNENVCEYLAKINLLIANTSYIQFEAILSGIQALQFPFSELIKDRYDFLKDELIVEFSNIEDLDSYFEMKITEKQFTYIKKNIENYHQLLNGINTIEGYNEILKKII
jgi:hypothetical protein